jgi:hypothetical protein
MTGQQVVSSCVNARAARRRARSRPSGGIARAEQLRPKVQIEESVLFGSDSVRLLWELALG